MALPTTEAGLRARIRDLTRTWNAVMDGVIPAALPYHRAAEIMAEKTAALRCLRKVLRRKHPHLNGDEITRLLTQPGRVRSADHSASDNET